MPAQLPSRLDQALPMRALTAALSQLPGSAGRKLCRSRRASGGALTADLI
jgi:hypothetical protein